MPAEGLRLPVHINALEVLCDSRKGHTLDPRFTAFWYWLGSHQEDHGGTLVDYKTLLKE